MLISHRSSRSMTLSSDRLLTSGVQRVPNDSRDGIHDEEDDGDDDDETDYKEIDDDNDDDDMAQIQLRSFEELQVNERPGAGPSAAIVDPMTQKIPAIKTGDSGMADTPGAPCVMAEVETKFIRISLRDTLVYHLAQITLTDLLLYITIDGNQRCASIGRPVRGPKSDESRTESRIEWTPQHFYLYSDLNIPRPKN